MAVFYKAAAVAAELCSADACLSWVCSTFTLVYLGMCLGLGRRLAYSSLRMKMLMELANVDRDALLQDPEIPTELTFAPGEGKSQLGCLVMKNAEFLAFPYSFCGQSTILNMNNRKGSCQFFTSCYSNSNKREKH